MQIIRYFLIPCISPPRHPPPPNFIPHENIKESNRLTRKYQDRGVVRCTNSVMLISMTKRSYPFHSKARVWTQNSSKMFMKSPNDGDFSFSLREQLKMQKVHFPETVFHRSTLQCLKKEVKPRRKGMRIWVWAIGNKFLSNCQVLLCIQKALALGMLKLTYKFLWKILSCLCHATGKPKKGWGSRTLKKIKHWKEKN